MRIAADSRLGLATWPEHVDSAHQGAAKQQGITLPLPADEVALAFQSLSLGLALESLTNPEAVRRGLGGDLATFLAAAISARAGSETS